MMQAESRMVPSEGRSHTRLQQALHCVYPTAANVASTTTNYSQVKDLGLVWEGFGSSKNSSGSGSSDGAAFLMELEPF